METIGSLENELRIVNKSIVKVNAVLTKWKKVQHELNRKKNELKKSINNMKSEQLASFDWGAQSYEWSEDVTKTLHEIFKLNSFRPKQLSAINSTLSGQHTLVVMPTGAGKSLCYQLPALVKPGITLVISPLISLIEDQVRSMNRKHIPAMLMNSTSATNAAALNMLKDKNSNTKILYVTPERLAKSKRFMAYLQKCHADGRLQRIAIDEVHCCSQWGHDFRPDYKFLGILSNMFKNVPILGLTATATAHVISDVQKMLNIPGCLIIKSTFNRPNLYYKILEKPKSQEDCLNILGMLLKHRYKGETGIIYTNSIKDAENIADGLNSKGLKVECYHANMEAGSRSRVHTKWHENYYQAIVATVAFGMGIDKPDVRFVIHHTISKSMENYYQESGRAGRDGLRAECLTLYRMQDIFKVSTMVFSSVGKLEHLYGMVKYCLNGTLCRRQLIAEHFDEDWGDADCKEMCDICSNPSVTHKEISLEAHCMTISSIIDKAHQQDIKLTAQKLLDAWFLKGVAILRHEGEEPKFSRAIAEDAIAFLLVRGYLIEDFHFTSYTTISYIKNGPNMESIQDDNFVLKMPVRKFIVFPLDRPAPKDGEVLNIKSTDSVKSGKRNSRMDCRPKKAKLMIVSEDDDDDED